MRCTPPILALLLVACEVQTEDAHLETVVEMVSETGAYQVLAMPEPDPPSAGPAALLVELDPGVTLLSVNPWMPDHGHGVSDAPEIGELLDGGFEATWTYTMSGYWELTLTLDGPEGEDVAVYGYEVQ